MTTEIERLARIIYSERGYELDDPWDDAIKRRAGLGMGGVTVKQDECLANVRASLTAMIEQPSEAGGNAMLAAMSGSASWSVVIAAYLQSILDENPDHA